MADRQQAAEIDDAAIEWASRSERGLSETERSELDRWLEADPRRLGAYVRAQAAWIHAERAVALGAMPQGDGREGLASARGLSVEEHAVPKRLDRRMVLGGSAALAASVAAIALIRRAPPRTLESGIGEIRRLTLADGTTLLLDTDTKVEIEAGSGERRLTLARGKVFLDVVRDGASALVIDAAGLMLQMAEGAFSVEAMAGKPLVALVTKGTLAVAQSYGFLREPQRRTLNEAQQLSLVQGASLAAADVRVIASAERDRVLAWREGMISFGGETLAMAVRAFDRYGRVRIIIADPALAQQKIAGLFRADDPRGFAATVAASFGGIISSQGDIIRILATKSSAQ